MILLHKSVGELILQWSLMSPILFRILKNSQRPLNMLEDLLEASVVIKGRKVSPKVRAMVVPGSQQVKMQAERIGLDKIFKDAGFEWRESGCSMCLGMNPDILAS